jgi:UDP-GlcNAc:undecaprenyl-phosphate GlcNAc-1-phosphate transferase
MRELLWLAGKALLIASIATPVIRDIFRSYNVVDWPGRRKVHAYPIPRVGGIAIVIAYGLALLLSRSATPLSSSSLTMWQIVPGAAIVFFTGLFDDFFTLRPRYKLLGVAVAACVVFWSGLRVSIMAYHPLSLWVDFPITVFWLLLTSNALNLIDGLDGLCAGMGLMSALTLFTAALLTHNLPLAYATLPLAGALLGFLFYNTNPATVFLGDSGALLIGFLLGCYGMVWTQKSSTLLSMIVPLLALSIPLVDVSLSVLRRFLAHKPIFRADKGHIHHRLLERGLTPRQAVLVLYLSAALAAAFALLATTRHGVRYQGLLIAVLCATAAVGIHKLRYAEFRLAGHLVFGGALTRAVDTKMRLANLAAALERAADPNAWWSALVAGGASLGVVALQWDGEGPARRDQIQQGVPLAWRFRVDVSEADSIEIGGGMGEPASALDLPAMAEILTRTFAAARERAGSPAKTMSAAV